ncbi:hypothetical protein WAI453_010755 [Rhynchosporium graminicola]
MPCTQERNPTFQELQILPTHLSFDKRRDYDRRKLPKHLLLYFPLNCADVSHLPCSCQVFNCFVLNVLRASIALLAKENRETTKSTPAFWAQVAQGVTTARVFLRTTKNTSSQRLEECKAGANSPDKHQYC